MSYMDPNMVRSPKSRLDKVEVVFDGGENQWSLAEIVWDKAETLGIRWNGNAENVGTPQSRGLATWFVLPQELHKTIRATVEEQMK